MEEHKYHSPTAGSDTKVACSSEVDSDPENNTLQEKMTTLKLAPLRSQREPLHPVHLPSLCELFGTLATTPASYKPLPTQPIESSEPKSRPSTKPDSVSSPVRTNNFIVIVGKEIQKRHRKRYHEVTRNFRCQHPGCNKAYGALNHLNAHLLALGHGRRRKAKEYRPISINESRKYSPSSSSSFTK